MRLLSFSSRLKFGRASRLSLPLFQKKSHSRNSVFFDNFSPIFQLYNSLINRRSNRSIMTEQPVTSKTTAVEERSSGDLVPEGYTKIVEGTAHMLYDKKEAVFYNKVQVFNRDLSIQVIKLFSETIESERKQKFDAKISKLRKKDNVSDVNVASPHPPRVGIRLLDALAATGLRSVRYLKEIPKLQHITINDILKDATDVALDNCKRNKVYDANRIEIVNRDATILMYEHRDPLQQYDVIDLDPYGTAVPFLDAAVQSVSGDGGLLCITCTDMAVLSGSYPEVCFAKYGSMPLKGKYAHEMALRILLNAVESAANRYKRHIVPWLSLSVDFYIRIFVRVYESPAEVKHSCLKRINVLQATQCPTFFVLSTGVRNNSKRQNAALQEKKEGTVRRGSQRTGKLAEQDIVADDDAAEAAAAEELTLRTCFLSQPPSSGPQGNYSAAPLSVPAECPESGSRFKLGGPYWGQPLHDQRIVDELLARVTAKLQSKASAAAAAATSSHGADAAADTCVDGYLAAAADDGDPYPIPTAKRIQGVLTAISEELKDVPLYYSLPDLASALSLTTPTLAQFTTAIRNGGYRVSQFHHDPSAIKTDAPNDVVWDIMRCFSKSKAAEGRKLSAVAQKILSKEPNFIADFKSNKNGYTRAKVARFQPNPEANWGPKRRAGRPPVAECAAADGGVEHENNNDGDLPPVKKSKPDN